MYWIDGDKNEGDQKNDLKDGKGIIYQIDGIDMKAIIKMVYMKEKEYIIMKMKR